MSDDQLVAKEAYFKEQEFLDIPNNERDIPNDSVDKLEQALEESKTMGPAALMRQTSSFLGLTPREAFEAHTRKLRARERQAGHRLMRSSTVPEPELFRSSSATKSRGRLKATVAAPKSKLKRVLSLPETADKDLTPFYIRVGDVPREYRNKKNPKPATNIQLEPEHKQYLKGKIVYFYPNDDIPNDRKFRIHKVIQLGAAWVKTWREDITHVIVDDEKHTYDKLLKHLNLPGLPENIVLVKYEPNVPECIQFRGLQDPSWPRFAPSGAPKRKEFNQPAVLSQSSAASQISLQIKSSTRQMAAPGLQNTYSYPEEERVPAAQLGADTGPIGSLDETVEDSFVMPSLRSTKTPQLTTIDNVNDDLSLAILETKATTHLPLEEDEDAKSPVASGVEDVEDSGTGEESVATTPKLPKKSNFISKASALRDKKPFNQDAFQCMNPGAQGYTSQNPNARTIDILDQMCKHYEQMQDTWRLISYRKCITTLKKQTVKITTAKQAVALPGIGIRLADKVEEIVLTDRLRRLESTRDDPLDSVLRLFLGVYGAGLVQANKWIQAGYCTLNDLRTKAKLTESNKVGVEHYEDFNSRISRAEVEAHGAIVIKELQKIDPMFKATIMGSYRRGAKDSGDIDMILTKPDTSPAAM
ncbi:DNA polymerase IV [Alternaria panax]|uniref:DNA polymerase n=1 Tax=Alternaria panax TaxID=48097 RepID=A0AAD4I7P7_9PLEO|nr:DNA polymerase IV [Alternaria panax]